MDIAFLFILGTVAGSFANVCIYRLPRKESVILPGSYCPYCRTQIRWFDNIPIVSFLLLGGRCRNCKKKISPRYIIVETLSGFIWVLLFLHFGLSTKFFIMLYFLSTLIVVSFIDLEFHEIPDSISLTGILFGLFAAFLYPPLMGEVKNLQSFLNSFLGVITGGTSIYFLGFIGEIIFKKEAMGGGDVKLLAMIGAFVGWKLALFVFFLAPFFGALVGITLKIKEGREIIPYAPYLSLATLVAVLCGDEILARLFIV